MVRKKRGETYDLWEAEKPIVKEGDDEEGVMHYLRQTGKLKPKFKNEYVPSVLPSVEPPKAGSSYNPAVDDYLEYANTIAAEEDTEIRKEQLTKRRMELKPGETYVTTAELRREEEMGFLDTDSEFEHIKTEDEIKTEDDAEFVEEKDVSKVVKARKPKTFKQRRRQLELRLEELDRLKNKRTKRQEAEYDRIKSILKEVKSELKQQASTHVKRLRKRVLHRFVGVKQLGHGKFEEYKEPVLLPSEIKGSYRALKPQGNIIKERMVSLQKRNMLQPKSTKKQKQLKINLKWKVTDKRDAREFMEAERAKLQGIEAPKKKRIRKRN